VTEQKQNFWHVIVLVGLGIFLKTKVGPGSKKLGTTAFKKVLEHGCVSRSQRRSELCWRQATGLIDKVFSGTCIFPKLLIRFTVPFMRRHEFGG